jgi:hypothetical protein
VHVKFTTPESAVRTDFCAHCGVPAAWPVPC